MIKILILLSMLNGYSEENYREIFSDHYVIASHFLDSNKSPIDSLAQIYDVDSDITSSIIFPELIRYSIIRDIIERNSLEIVYVNTGKVDFSIGSLQIKPSFAEKIEKIVREGNDFAEFRKFFSYDSQVSVEQRKERLQRLKNFDSQIHYVLAFQRFIENRFPFLDNYNLEYKIRFISTAYNYNFSASRKKIESYMERAFYPWGILNNREKYNYSDISWYYYCHEIK